MIIYPEKIVKGCTFGTTASSDGARHEKHIIKLDNAMKNLKELGFNGIETSNTRTLEKISSSDGKTRAKEFMELWQNEDVKWIIITRGGEFLIEMLPYLDKEIIANNTCKWVQGFSDVSLLLLYLTTNFNIATVHAESIGDFSMTRLEKAVLKTIEILEECGESKQENFELYEIHDYRTEDYLAPYNPTEKVEYKHLYNKPEDKITGRMIGGCIDTIAQLMGTKLDNTANFCNQFEEGMIWYLENCELTIPALYRTLLQMKNNGWFENVKGFIFGRTASKEPLEDFTYEDLLHKICDDFNVPVIYDIDIGHVAPQWTIINGAYGEFEYNNGKGTLIQKMI